MKTTTKNKLIAIMNTDSVFTGEDIQETASNIYNLYRDDFAAVARVFYDYKVNHEDAKQILDFGNPNN